MPASLLSTSRGTCSRARRCTCFCGQKTRVTSSRWPAVHPGRSPIKWLLLPSFEVHSQTGHSPATEHAATQGASILGGEIFLHMDPLLTCLPLYPVARIRLSQESLDQTPQPSPSLPLLPSADLPASLQEGPYWSQGGLRGGHHLTLCSGPKH